MNEEILLIQLRDCFTAGYTMPQFCIDNGIKKPLFVALDERHATFMWEIYVQFKFDKRINPRFTLLNGNVNPIRVAVACMLPALTFESPNKINWNGYDKIIFLTQRRLTSKLPHGIYLDELINYFTNMTYAEIPLLNFLQNNQKVKLVVVTHPNIQENANNTERETQFFVERAEAPLFKIRGKIDAAGGEHVPTPYDFLGYSNEDVYKLLGTPSVINNADGSTTLKDDSDELINVVNGKRATAYQPENYMNKIYFVGNCIYYGFGVPYQKTLESYLQKLLNQHNFPYRVENESQPLDSRYQDIFYNLNNLQPKPGDIIFVCLQDLIPLHHIPCFDVRRILDRPHHYGEVFADFCHVNELGHYALAEKFFYLLIQHNFFKDVDFNYPPTYASASLRHSA